MVIPTFANRSAADWAAQNDAETNGVTHVVFAQHPTVGPFYVAPEYERTLRSGMVVVFTATPGDN